MSNGLETVTPTLTDRFLYIAPFIGMGAAGGVIRELNTKTFSWRELFVRAITGAFGASLVGLYLTHTAYTMEMQYAIAGAVGATACELIQAIQKWLITKMGGGYFNSERESDSISNRLDTPSDDTPVFYLGDDIFTSTDSTECEKTDRSNDKHQHATEEGTD